MRTRAGWLAALGVLSAGCASTQVSMTWRNPTLAGEIPRKVLVTAEVPTAAARHQLEQQLSKELAAAGFSAVPFTSVQPAGRKPDAGAVQEALRTGGFDGVLVSRLLGTTQRYDYSPGAYGWRGPLYGYGVGYWDLVQAAHLETSLYSVVDGRRQLVWSGTSSTFPSGASGLALSGRDIAHFTKVIASRLTRDVFG